MGEVVWFINVQMVMQIVMYDAGELLKKMFTTVVELNYVDLCFLSMISTYIQFNEYINR